MRSIIIPAEVQEGTINLCDVTMDNLIVAYSNNEAVGFVVYMNREWSIQTDSDHESVTGRWYRTLTELARTESKEWANFSLKVL
jgi:hypothetical protein